MFRTVQLLLTNFMQVTSDDPSLLVVREPQRKSVSEQNIVYYPVELQVAASVWKGAPPVINVEVKCPTTGQVHQVPVRIQRGDQSGNSAVVICCYIILQLCASLDGLVQASGQTCTKQH